MKEKIKEILNIINYINLKKIYTLRNKDVFIIGSAPNPNLELYSENQLIISCNASALSAKENNLPDPHLTIVDNELIDNNVAFIKPSRSKIINNDLLKNIKLGKLISVQSNSSKGGSPQILKAKYDSYDSINNSLRRMILKSVLKINWIEQDDRSLASTGGFTIALCAFLNAKTITFEGFNLFQGESNDLKHFYDTDNKIPENISKLNTKAHSLADSLIISCLVAQNIKIFTTEQDFFPLLNNWGKPEFKYKKDN